MQTAKTGLSPSFQHALTPPKRIFLTLGSNCSLPADGQRRPRPPLLACFAVGSVFHGTGSPGKGGLVPGQRAWARLRPGGTRPQGCNYQQPAWFFLPVQISWAKVGEACDLSPHFLRPFPARHPVWGSRTAELQPWGGFQIQGEVTPWGFFFAPDTQSQPRPETLCCPECHVCLFSSASNLGSARGTKNNDRLGFHGWKLLVPQIQGFFGGPPIHPRALAELQDAKHNPRCKTMNFLAPLDPSRAKPALYNARAAPPSTQHASRDRRGIETSHYSPPGLKGGFSKLKNNHLVQVQLSEGRRRLRSLGTEM